MKYALLLLGVLLWAACTPSTPPMESRLEALTEEDRPKMDSFKVPAEGCTALENLQDSANFPWLHKLVMQGRLLGTDEDDHMDTVSLETFRQRVKSSRVIQVDAHRRIIIVARDYYDEGMYEFLFLKKEPSTHQWWLCDHDEQTNRLSVDAHHVEWDSAAQVLWVEVEQEWSSDGDLHRRYFYKCVDGQLKKVLQQYSSGGQEMEHGAFKNSCCYLATNFYSGIDSVTQERLYSSYEYELLVNGICDGGGIEQFILKGKTPIAYVWNDSIEEFKADWTSLQGLNQAQFEQITSWHDLEAFAPAIRRFIQRQGTHLPQTAACLQQAL